jgi:hypothetical protein
MRDSNVAAPSNSIRVGGWLYAVGVLAHCECVGVFGVCVCVRVRVCACVYVYMWMCVDVWCVLMCMRVCARVVWMWVCVARQQKRENHSRKAYINT